MGTLRAEAPQFLMVLDLNENKRFLKERIACQSFTLNVLSLLVIVFRRVVYNYKKWSSLFPETAPLLLMGSKNRQMSSTPFIVSN